MNPITMALVDDDELFVLLTKRIISRTDLVDQLQVYKNGLDAINYLTLNSNNPDALPEIILLDLSMPILNGWQFLEAYSKIVSSIEKKITIYIYSSSISPDDFSRSKLIKEVSGYFVKPINREKIVHIVEAYHKELASAKAF
jgi:CheY-like chemotaxis protein